MSKAIATKLKEIEQKIILRDSSNEQTDKRLKLFSLSFKNDNLSIFDTTLYINSKIVASDQKLA
jgi:hypothetical protein